MGASDDAAWVVENGALSVDGPVAEQTPITEIERSGALLAVFGVALLSRLV